MRPTASSPDENGKCGSDPRASDPKVKSTFRHDAPAVGRRLSTRRLQFLGLHAGQNRIVAMTHERDENSAGHEAAKMGEPPDRLVPAEKGRGELEGEPEADRPEGRKP